MAAGAADFSMAGSRPNSRRPEGAAEIRQRPVGTVACLAGSIHQVDSMARS
jgi:hypothetical protein